MSNPNNCSTCEWKKTPQGGWCYMFRDEPSKVCMKHTGRDFADLEKQLAEAQKLCEIYFNIAANLACENYVRTARDAAIDRAEGSEG